MLTLLDLDSLDIRQGSFVDESLQEHHTDLLYEVALQNETPLYIYLLFEHKSYPDDWVAFQLLRYMLRIWEQDQEQDRPLQAIMPLVLYHGEQRWRVSQSFASLFSLPEALRPYFPEFQYALFDLSQYSDEEIQGNILLQVSLRLLKYSRSDDLRSKLFEMIDLWVALSEQETGLEMLRTMFIYLSRGTDKVVEADLLALSEQAFTEKGADIMGTIAEKWLEEGIAIGEERGIEAGERQALLTTIEKVLFFRFEAVPEDLPERLAGLELDALKVISELTFEVADLAEFMAGFDTLYPLEPDLDNEAKASPSE